MPVLESEEFQVYPDIVFPPVAGIDQLRVSLSTPAKAVGVAIFAGTVVAVAEEETTAFEDPDEFVATTLNV